MNQAFVPPLTKSAAVRWSGWLLAALVRASGAIFGLNILLFIRSRRGDHRKSSVAEWVTAAVLLAATVFIVVVTWFFTVRFWGPGMASGMSGAALPG